MIHVAGWRVAHGFSIRDPAGIVHHDVSIMQPVDDPESTECVYCKHDVCAPRLKVSISGHRKQLIHGMAGVA